MSFDLRGDGKVMLVTGGAQGMGLAMGEAFAAAGYRVALVDLDAEAGRSREAALRARGHAALFAAADVTREAEVEAAVAAVLAAWGRLDVVINNAGILGRAAPIHELSESDLERVLDVDLKAPFLVCKHAVRAQRARGGGVILNIASITAEAGAALYAPYSAAKAGVMALTRSLARQVGRFNIRINCISPGSVRGTRFLQTELGRELTGEEERRLTASLLQKIPLARAGQPQDVAHLALFLASPLAAHIHGAVLTVDGGEHLGVQG
jgi:NAD(P)-dependent dehydrogenase (short-subunit alcohol dehydrogenase family)